MSQGTKCACDIHPAKRPFRWRVVQREGNASAFNGYHWQRSDYSSVRCTVCGHIWRTKARYVKLLPDEETAK